MKAEEARFAGTAMACSAHEVTPSKGMKMYQQNFMKSALSAAVLALFVGQAQSATVDINLTGLAADLQHSTWDNGVTQYDQWLLPLSGFDPAAATTVSVGDIINATVTLDQSITIPASVDLTFFQLNLSGSAFPAGDTGTKSAAISFFNNGVLVASGGSDCTTSSQLASCHVYFAPNNPAMTFDKITDSFTISALGGPATLDNGRLVFTLFSPAVPEPESYAMGLAGLATLGFMLRRRKAA
jgi:hypothetical protein